MGKTMEAIEVMCVFFLSVIFDRGDECHKKEYRECRDCSYFLLSVSLIL